MKPPNNLPSKIQRTSRAHPPSPQSGQGRSLSLNLRCHPSNHRVDFRHAAAASSLTPPINLLLALPTLLYQHRSTGEDTNRLVVRVRHRTASPPRLHHASTPPVRKTIENLEITRQPALGNEALLLSSKKCPLTSPASNAGAHLEMWGTRLVTAANGA